jgi:hypothetical protein
MARTGWLAISLAGLVCGCGAEGDGGLGMVAQAVGGPTVTSVTLNPSSIAGGCGGSSTATVTLSAAAPAGGQSVSLTSSIPALAAAPPALTVPAGQTSASVTVWTNAKYRDYSGLAFSPVISASANGSTQSATLSVSAAIPPADIQNDTADRHGTVCGGSFPATFGERGILYQCFAGPTPGTVGHCTFKQECLEAGCVTASANGFQFGDGCGTGIPYPISESPSQAVGAASATGTITSVVTAPVNGLITTIHDSLYCVSTPYNVTIPQGQSSATFAISNTDTSVGQFVGLGIDLGGNQEGLSFYTVLPSGNCQPVTCASAGYECDIFTDGCCGYIDCGTCTAPNTTCGGGGVIGKCGCTPTNECQVQGYSCGNVSDGCGGTLNCGSCPGGQYCATFYHWCEVCPSSCSLLGACGSLTDPCTGNKMNCGSCPNGDPCINNKCCTRQDACANNGYNCGSASDGCGGTLNCGACASGQVCVNNICMNTICGGTRTCTPVTCGYLGMNCGTTADGCGGTLNCGSCPAGSSCVNNVCISNCTPYTCSQLHYNCGSAPDGCGGTLNCGRCGKRQTCVNNVCH